MTLHCKGIDLKKLEQQINMGKSYPCSKTSCPVYDNLTKECTSDPTKCKYGKMLVRVRLYCPNCEMDFESEIEKSVTDNDKVQCKNCGQGFVIKLVQATGRGFETVAGSNPARVK